MKQRYASSRCGFALLEALIASLILGSAVVSLVAMSSKSMYRTKMNRDYDLAWQFADQQLTKVQAMGIDPFVLEGQREGVSHEFGPEFHWTISLASLSLGNLYEVRIQVQWYQQNRIENIVAATMLNGQYATTASGGGEVAE